jgi:TetR/AcrR family transcriptional regulator, transcriptional repressor of bet genes
MALRSIADLRREEMAAAALNVFLEHGADGLTLERVSKITGSSKALILHHFGTKDALFDHVFADVLRILAQERSKALAQTSSDKARAEALLGFCFQPDLFTASYAATWLSVMDGARSKPVFAQVRRILAKRLRLDLLVVLRPLLGKTEARAVAASLQALIDGLWLRRALDPESLSPVLANALAQTHLEESLAFL